MHYKKFPSFFMLLMACLTFSQEASEIYLFDFQYTGDNYVLSNPINISNHPGYDNQPSFTEDGESILFTSFREGQADISIYDIKMDFRNWLTNTPQNEISPSPYPGKKKFFTYIKTENNQQNIYTSSYKNKPPKPLIVDKKIAYYAWFSEDIMVTYVLGDNDALFIEHFKHKITYPIQQQIGRSFERIPGTNLIGFISMSHEVPEIYSINPLTNKMTYIVDALEDSKDCAFTDHGSILMAKEDKIYKFRQDQDQEWTPIIIESDIPLKGISRLTISPNGRKIAVVVAE